jgi:hypothetical protein
MVLRLLNLGGHIFIYLVTRSIFISVPEYSRIYPENGFFWRGRWVYELIYVNVGGPTSVLKKKNGTEIA